jgi:hypothetical protein
VIVHPPRATLAERKAHTRAVWLRALDTVLGPLALLVFVLGLWRLVSHETGWGVALLSVGFVLGLGACWRLSDAQPVKADQ